MTTNKNMKHLELGSSTNPLWQCCFSRIWKLFPSRSWHCGGSKYIPLLDFCSYSSWNLVWGRRLRWILHHQRVHVVYHCFVSGVCLRLVSWSGRLRGMMIWCSGYWSLLMQGKTRWRRDGWWRHILPLLWHFSREGLIGHIITWRISATVWNEVCLWFCR